MYFSPIFFSRLSFGWEILEWGKVKIFFVGTPPHKSESPILAPDAMNGPRSYLSSNGSHYQFAENHMTKIYRFAIKDGILKISRHLAEVQIFQVFLLLEIQCFQLLMISS